MNTAYAYLVSDGKKITIALEKPKDDPCVVSDGKWYTKPQGFEFSIGQAITVYTDDPWKGVIGVYDISIPDHVIALAKDMRSHTLSVAERRMESEIHALFGDVVSTEVRGYIWTSDGNKRRNHKWSPLGKLLWDATSVMKKICFQEV